jgi:hypothetical protein
LDTYILVSKFTFIQDEPVLSVGLDSLGERVVGFQVKGDQREEVAFAHFFIFRESNYLISD